MEPYEKVASGLIIGAMMATAGLITYVWANPEPWHPGTSNSLLSTFSSRGQVFDFFKLSERSGSDYYAGDTRQSLGIGEQFTSSDSYSRTNIQVAGVDEMDTVKTDGRYIYIVSSNGVSVLNAYPADALGNVSRINETTIFGQDDPELLVSFDGLFVVPQKLVVLSTLTSNNYYLPIETAISFASTSQLVVEAYVPRSFIFVFNMSNPAQPALESSIGVPGYLQAARMIDDTVYVIAQQHYYSNDAYQALPKLWVGDDADEFSLDSIYYDPDMRDQNSFLNMLAFDVSSEEHGSISVVAGYASTIYMSTQSIYLTNQKWVGNLILTDGQEVVEDYNTITTTIYKVSFDGLSMKAVARGDVNGWLLNQFSMDEKDSLLRLATTNMWFQPSERPDTGSSVYILDPDLNVVGKLTGIAPNESIYSTRFVGDSLYMVTFRQVDPLFVIDLTDPTDPMIVGELEMPGFSNYLHPVDATHVLGIGSENSKVKVSLYNVSDPTAPVEQSKYVLDGFYYSGSDAQYDHKAVLFDLEKGILVIPIYAYGAHSSNESVWTWSSYISGALCLKISVEDGISFFGIVEHMNSTQYSYEHVFRSLYIGEYLYTISYTVVKASMLSDLSEVSSLIYWSYENYGYYYVR